MAGDAPVDGRDEVPGPMRVTMGAFAGRRLELDIVERDERDGRRRLVLARGAARVIVTLTVTDESPFIAGDAQLSVPDRVAGAAFADELAALFRTPLATVVSDTAFGLPVPIEASWARIGRQRDADGVTWEALKLFAGEDDAAGELFLRLSERQAVISEKSSSYRIRWLAMIEGAFGHGREAAARRAIVLAGGARLSVPVDWRLDDRGGRLRAAGPSGRAELGASWLAAGALPGLPHAAARLRVVLDAEGALDATIATNDLGDLETAWAEYMRGGDPLHLPHRRALIAVGEHGQVLMLGAYAPDDAAWFVPEWERIVTTLSVP